MLWWTFHVRQLSSQEMREKLFGNVNEYKVSKFEACYREYFCLQYSAFHVFVGAWNMQVCVNTVTLPCLRFCTYMLTLIKIFFSAKSCSMSFAKPSYTFKLKSVLYSTDFPWRSATIYLDKVVYFTLKQTPKNRAVCNVFLEKELLPQNMLIKIKILMLKLF